MDSRYFIDKINTITQWALVVVLLIGGGGIIFTLGLILVYLIAVNSL